MTTSHKFISESTLPRQLTTFVGRVDEVAKIGRLLCEPNCRLLTLVGAGGIGKTRLALEVAATLTDYFSDGVFLVALQDATTALAVVTTTAHALRCPLAGSHDPQTQLFHFLANKKLLLVLDNLEQLLEEVELLAALLASAPGVKVLATSREVLNLRDEWLYSVDALPIPDGRIGENGLTTDLEMYDAVRLFTERARRARSDFALEIEAADVVRICRLVGGMPLAIELAAAWLKTLTCGEIASEIQQSVDFLTTNQRDVTERHRSIRAVCDHSWQRLSVAERNVFMSLAVFQGGFQRNAAQEVAGATLPILATLVEKSLLRWEPERRRYQMHELLRQYALEQLMQQAGSLDRAKARHCAYYVTFLHTQGKAILGGRQRAAIFEIEAELGNVRLAWQWAVITSTIDKSNMDELITLARTLIDYYQMRSRYLEGAQTLAQAMEQLRSASPPETITPAMALLLTYQGSLYIRLGRIDEAKALLQEAQRYYVEHNLPPMPGYNTDPAFSLGIIALIQGNYQDASRLGKQVYQTSKRNEHPHNLLLAHYLLAVAALAEGELARAQHHAESACEIARVTASHWFMAYCLNELGNIAFVRGDYAAAHSHYAESYTIRQEFDDPEGMALALIRLGETALAQDNYTDARDLFQKGQMLYQQIDDQGGLTAAFTGLGGAAVGLQQWTLARDYLYHALTLALAVHYLPYLGSILYSIALLLLATNQAAQGVTLLAVIARHPATPRVLIDRLHSQLSADLSYLSPDFLAATSRLEGSIDLEAIASDLLLTLTRPPSFTPSFTPSLTLALTPALAPPSVSPTSPLLEPLSERELELLRLLAAGLKNREIATQMVISINTVKVHINNIYGKLGVSSRIQAVARAQELALI